MRYIHLEGFARILPILLIVSSLAALLTGGIIFGRWDYSVRGLIAAVPTIIGSIILLYMFKHPIGDDDKSIALFSAKTAPFFLFILLFLISVIILVSGIDRIVYFFVIVALYFTIFIQIFSEKISSKAIILEIMSLMANVIYGTTLIYPLFFRTTDVMGHNILSTVVFLSGHIIPVDLDASYSSFPLFHIYNAISSNILGLSAQDTQFIVTCPAYLIVIFFQYRIFMIFSKNKQISLLSCLCISLNPIILSRGIEMVTSVAAFVGFIVLLYLIFASNENVSLLKSNTNSVIFKSLIILISIYIILVHQVSIVQIVILIALFMACESLFSEIRCFSAQLIKFIVVFFSAYWLFSAWIFAGQLIKSRIGLDHSDFGSKYQMLSDSSLSQMQVSIAYLQNQIDMGVLLFFALIGIGYTLYRRKPQYIPVVSMFSLIVLVLYAPNPLLTSQTFSRMYRIDRFWILISPFMAFASASGIFWLSKFSQRHYRSKTLYLLIAFLFTILIVFSLQNPILEITSKEGRLYFSNGELSGYDFVTEKIPYGSKLLSDYETSRLFCLNYFSLTDELGLPFYSSIILKDLNLSLQEDEYVIFRDSKFEDGSIILKFKNGMKVFASNEENTRDVREFYNINNKLYNNNYISIII